MFPIKIKNTLLSVDSWRYDNWYCWNSSPLKTWEKRNFLQFTKELQSQPQLHHLQTHPVPHCCHGLSTCRGIIESLQERTQGPCSPCPRVRSKIQVSRAHRYVHSQFPRSPGGRQSSCLTEKRNSPGNTYASLTCVTPCIDRRKRPERPTCRWGGFGSVPVSVARQPSPHFPLITLLIVRQDSSPSHLVTVWVEK